MHVGTMFLPHLLVSLLLLTHVMLQVRSTFFFLHKKKHSGVANIFLVKKKKINHVRIDFIWPDQLCKFKKNLDYN
jgi:hypothetical protein